MTGEVLALQKVTGIKCLLAKDLRKQMALLCWRMDQLNDLLGDETADLDLLSDEKKAEILRQIEAVNRFRFRQ